MSELKSWSFDLTDEVMEKAIKFHTKPSPGTYIGVYLLKYLTDNLGEVEGKLHIITETGGCLLDVAQAVLNRTMGNKYLRLKRLGNFAYTGYGRENPKKALRVYVDIEKVDKNKYPNLYGFFTSSRDYEKYDRKQLNKFTISEFLEAKDSIFSMEWVEIKSIPYKPDMPVKKICDTCGQSFATKDYDEKTCKLCNEDIKYFERK